MNKMCGAAEGSTPSIATISSQRDTPQQRVIEENPHSCNSWRFLHHEGGVRPGRQGVAMSGSKSEDLQENFLGLMFNSSIARLANESWEHSAHNEGGCSQGLDNGSDAAQKERLFKEARGFKRRKERKQQDSLTTTELVHANNSDNPSSLSP